MIMVVVEHKEKNLASIIIGTTLEKSSQLLFDCSIS